MPPSGTTAAMIVCTRGATWSGNSNLVRKSFGFRNLRDVKVIVINSQDDAHCHGAFPSLECENKRQRTDLLIACAIAAKCALAVLGSQIRT